MISRLCQQRVEYESGKTISEFICPNDNVGLTTLLREGLPEPDGLQIKETYRKELFFFPVQ